MNWHNVHDGIIYAFSHDDLGYDTFLGSHLFNFLNMFGVENNMYRVYQNECNTFARLAFRLYMIVSDKVADIWRLYNRYFGSIVIYSQTIFLMLL